MINFVAIFDQVIPILKVIVIDQGTKLWLFRKVVPGPQTFLSISYQQLNSSFDNCMSIGRHWKYLSRFSHLYSRINLILMGMLTLERGSAECREGENWRWCCKLNFRAAAWKIQHYTMQELMVHFLQLLVTSGSKIGSFLSLACNVHSWLKLFLMDWLFLCICSFTRYFFFHLYKVFSYFSVQNSENIFEEFLVHLLFLPETLQCNCLTFLTEKSDEHWIHYKCDYKKKCSWKEIIKMFL